MLHTIHGNVKEAGSPRVLLPVYIKELFRREPFLSPAKGVVSVSLKGRQGAMSRAFLRGGFGSNTGTMGCGQAPDDAFPFGFGESLTEHPEASPADTKACLARNYSSRP